MTWAEFALALVGAIPELLKLLDSLRTSADQAEQQGIGRQLAVSQALLVQAAQIEAANQAKAEAAARHAGSTGDDAFDPDFKRKDGT